MALLTEGKDFRCGALTAPRVRRARSSHQPPNIYPHWFRHCPNYAFVLP